MLIPIYRKTETGFEQQFIEDNELVEPGWTTNLDELDIEEEVTELDKVKQENMILTEAITELAEVVSRQDEAIMDMAQTISDVVQGGVANG